MKNPGWPLIMPLLIVLLWLSAAPAHGFTLMGYRTALFEKHHYSSWTGLAAMDYYLLPPPATEPGKTYPLVVTLHGASRHSMAAYILSLEGMRKIYPAYILVPVLDDDVMAFFRIGLDISHPAGHESDEFMPGILG